MELVQLILVVIVTLSAAVSGAMDAVHAAVVEYKHMAMGKRTDDEPVCCSESTERTQSCDFLPALLPCTMPLPQPVRMWSSAQIRC